MSDTVDNLKAIVELEQKINELRAEGKKLTEEEKLLLDNLELALEARREKEKNSIELQQKRIDNIKVELEQLKVIYELTEKKTIADKENFEIETRSKELQKQKLEFEKEFASLNDDERKKRIEDIQKAEYDLKIVKQKKEATDNIAKTIAEKFGIKAPDGSIFDLLSNDKGNIDLNTFADSISTVSEKLGEFFNAQQIGASIMMHMYNATKDGVITLDAQAASLRKATGAIDGYIFELNMAANSVGMSGVGMEKTGEAMVSLARNFSNFTDVSSAARIEMAGTVATLNNLGVSSDIASKNMSTLIQAFGMSASQASETSKELAVLANTLGTSPEKIASDFASAASTLVVYGNQGIQVFKGLEAAAKASGLEVNTLLGIVKKMDTFQGAAEAAGKLNAVLGGGLLNSSQLLVATEEQRIRMVVESVQLQGIQFGDLDKYTQMTIANAAGISDMAQANKLFGMSLNEYDKYAAQTEKSKEATEKFAEMSLAATNSMDKLKVAAQQLAFFLTPIVFVFSNLIEGFAIGISVINEIVSRITQFANWIGQTTGTTKFFSEVINFLATGFKYLFVAVGAAVGVFVAYRSIVLLSQFATLAFKATVEGLTIAKGSLSTVTAFLTAMKTKETAATYINDIATKANSAGVALNNAMKTANIFATIRSTAATALSTTATIAKSAALFSYNIAAGLATLVTTGLSFIMGILGVAVTTATWPVVAITVGIIALAGIVYYAWNNFDKWGKVILFILGPLGWLIAGIKMLVTVFTQRNSPALYELPDVLAGGLVRLANVIMTVLRPALDMITSPLRAFSSLLSGVVGFVGKVGNAIFGNADKTSQVKAEAEASERLVNSTKEIKGEGIVKVHSMTKQVAQLTTELNAMAMVAASAPLVDLVKAITAQQEVKDKQEQKDLIFKLNDKVLGNFVIETINSYGGGNVAVKKATAAGTKG